MPDIVLNNAFLTLSDNAKYAAVEFQCCESLSDEYTLSVLIASNDEISSTHLGKELFLTVADADEQRVFSAICLRISLIDVINNQYQYKIEGVDPLSLLALRRDWKIFQNMTAHDIIESVLIEANLNQYVDFSVSGSGHNYEYCTQLNETDKEFIQRILFAQGWFYCFDNTSRHLKIKVIDSNKRFVSIHNPTINFLEPIKSSNRLINGWSSSFEVGSASTLAADHNQLLPQALKSGKQQSQFSHQLKKIDQYHFALGEQEQQSVRQSAKLYMQSVDAAVQQFYSATTVLALSASSRFSLAHHPVDSLNQEYIVTKVTHQFVAQGNVLGEGRYNNQIQCIPYTTTYRPNYQAKPIINNLFTACVTGPNDEEIYRDETGRIKVKFHWDRYNKADENSSCWLPVSQSFAGNGFGSYFTPRVGDEVLVQFIAGDPDRPVIVGSLYNKTKGIPFKSPSCSGIKTRTTPNGSRDQGNELRFEDKKEEEEIALCAQRDLLCQVKNDFNVEVNGLKKVSIEKSFQMNAKEQIVNSTDKTISLIAKEQALLQSDDNVAISAGKDAKVNASNHATIDATSIALTAASSITLTVGGSKIEITNTGVVISSPSISISGQAKAEMSAAMVDIQAQGIASLKGISVTVQGSAMTEITAGAMAKVQGAITMIN